MARFIDGIDREQVTLFPERLKDWIGDVLAYNIKRMISLTLMAAIPS